MKKRISALILCICFAAAASGCGNTEDTDNRERNVQEERTGAGEDSGTAADESTADTSELQENAPQTSGNILVAYFSWADNAILADDVDAVASPSVIPPGNVQQLAGMGAGRDRRGSVSHTGDRALFQRLGRMSGPGKSGAAG